MSHYNTFWNIINSAEIVIPTIQRDYAYGRPVASNILNKLLADIKLTLDDSEDKLHLAFVYGKLEGKTNDEVLKRNSANIKALLQSVKEYAVNLDIQVAFDAQKSVIQNENNIKFIPIDGQQRLTTLYLLHWYLATKLNLKEDLDILSKFQYATRTSSTEFCALLIELGKNYNNSKALTANYIQNNENYFTVWGNDPTVKNMMIVIDVINKHFKGSREHYKDYWTALATNEMVCFDFFNLDNYQLTDELYVKMNSRGRTLSQFENFKAWLYFNMVDKINDEAKKKIDINWHDLFWKAKSQNVPEIDSAYLQWFKNLFLASFLRFVTYSATLEEARELEEMNDSDDYTPINNSDTKSIILTLKKKGSGFLDILKNNQNLEIRNEFLKNVPIYLERLERLELIDNKHPHLLDLSINPSYSKLTLRQMLFSNAEELNWWDRTMQYAIIEYLTLPSKANVLINEVDFIRFLRIISNLIYNTTIESPGLFRQAIDSIQNIISSTVENSIKNMIEDHWRISFFSKEQIEEETTKAKLIYNNGKECKRCEEAFVEAERNRYFHGQIGFLFNFVGEPFDINTFINYSTTFQNLFSEHVLSKPNNFLFRGLLAKLGVELFIINGKQLRYPVNDRSRLRIRNENWRRCLLSNQKIGNFLNFFKSVKLTTPEEAKTYLRNAIKQFSNEESFLYPIVKNERLLNNALKHCLFNYNNDFSKICLLNTTSTRGFYRELYTADWYFENSQAPPLIINNIWEVDLYSIQYEVNEEPGLRFIKTTNRDIHYYIYKVYGTDKFDLSKWNTETVGGKLKYIKEDIKREGSISNLIKYIDKL